MTSELYWAHRCYDRAYEQIEVLTDKLEELTTRYASSDRPFRRQIAIRKRTMRALIFVYYNYLRLKKVIFWICASKYTEKTRLATTASREGFFEEEDELEDHSEEEEETTTTFTIMTTSMNRTMEKQTTTHGQIRI